MNQAAFDCLSVALNPAIDHSLSIPHFAAGKVNRVAAEERRPAGKGVNVGVAVARAGFRVAVSGFLGEDNAGRLRAFSQIRHSGRMRTRRGVHAHGDQDHRSREPDHDGYQLSRRGADRR